ncbi:Annexin B9 [Pseudolycoriella hygida]|uniref:Annexin B9 n=1 Tax=Pseudolycoriella hygida TaxID=35572 RepID=A0A9Q0N504_9DIPT|nr:Annexin B9 [Pseudolycoriella hygida]
MLKYVIVVITLSISQQISAQLQWPNLFGTNTNNNNYTLTIPTVVPAKPFNAVHTCELLKLSMQGVGRNSDTIMKILATHTFDQRSEIAATYKTLYNQDLVQKLITEYDGYILDVIKYLFWPREKMYARELHDAMQGLGTDEDALIEMCASLDGHELRRVSSAYIQLYEKTLETDIKGDTSGFFRDLLVELIKGREPDNSPNSVQLPRYTVETLNNMGQGQWSNNKDTIRNIFCKKSFTELREIFAEYERRNGRKIEMDIESEFRSDAKRTLLAIGR